MSAPMANASSGAVLGVLSLFNGFTANRLNMPVWLYWIQYMSPFYWGFVAVSIPLMQTYLPTTTTPAPLLIASGGAGGNLVEEPGNIGDDFVIGSDCQIIIVVIIAKFDVSSTSFSCRRRLFLLVPRFG